MSEIEIIREGKKGCPSCNSLSIEEVDDSPGVFWGILDIFLGDHKRTYECKDCGAKWKR